MSGNGGEGVALAVAADARAEVRIHDLDASLGSRAPRRERRGRPSYGDGSAASSSGHRFAQRRDHFGHEAGGHTPAMSLRPRMIWRETSFSLAGHIAAHGKDVLGHAEVVSNVKAVNPTRQMAGSK